MGVQQRVHRPIEYDLPTDFAERLELFKKASGLSWKALARLLGVSLHRLRQWRNKGASPNPAHLFLLMTIADVMGLRDGILMQPSRDLPDTVELEVLRQYFQHTCKIEAGDRSCSNQAIRHSFRPGQEPWLRL